MVALPDFEAGAMENWGLITYREVAMLYEPGVSSIGNKESVTSVIAHELAHQVCTYQLYTSSMRIVHRGLKCLVNTSNISVCYMKLTICKHCLPSQ